MISSAEKRKMVRMHVDLPVSIFFEKPDRQSDASVLDLSIYGMAFGSKRYLSRGTQFQILFPDQGTIFDKRRIQAEVVRCESLGGFSDGKFKIGAKFLFKFNGPDSASLPRNEESTAHPVPYTAGEPASTRNESVSNAPNEQFIGLNAPNRATWIMQKGEIKAEYCQAIRLSADKKEKTIYTLIKVQEPHSSNSPFMFGTPEPFDKIFKDLQNGGALSQSAKENQLEKIIPEVIQ